MVQFIPVVGQVNSHSRLNVHNFNTLTPHYFYAIIMILMLIYTELLSPLEQIHFTDVEIPFSLTPPWAEKCQLFR